MNTAETAPRTNTDFDLDAFWQSEAQEHMDVAQQTFASMEDVFGQWLDVAVNTVRNGNKIFFFGNGGSAADAQHLATELTVRYKDDRAPIPAIALTTDSSALTAGGNDMGFDQIFARQLDALGQPGDMAIGISTSGNSHNVLNALKTARKKEIITVGLSGKGGGSMPDFCDILLTVPSNTTARIQEMHITLGQMFCGALELKLGLV